MAASVKTCRTCGREFSGGETFCPTDGARLLIEGDDDRNAAQGDEQLVGQTLDGRYRIIDVIGQGGMGIVYEAEHVLIEKRVAVKVLRQDFTRKPDVVERFRQEARSASKIGHPNIIDVIDFGETPTGASYFVMEKLEGEDLAEVLCRECVLAPARAVTLIYQCCRALAEAHKKGIFHRDLKPENLFLVRTQSGAESVKVVDFGVAKMTDRPDEYAGGTRRLTRTGMLFGTPEYMSPEQARGVALDNRADIYALGIILYELATGRVPFEGSNFMEVLSKHGSEALPPLTEANPGTIVSEPLRMVIERALCKDREARFQTMDEMADALAAVPEMPALNGDSPPPWALSVPSTAAVGSARQRISMEPMRSVTSGLTGRFRHWHGRLGPHYFKIGVAAAAVVVIIALVSALAGDDPRETVAPGEEEAESTTTEAKAATVPAESVPSAAVPEMQKLSAHNRDVGNGSEATGMVLSDPINVSGRLRRGDRLRGQADGMPEEGRDHGRRRHAGGSSSVIVGEPMAVKSSAAEVDQVGANTEQEPGAGGTTVWSDGVVVVSSEETVAVRITSRPSGAKILSGDYHAGCNATPCIVRLPKARSALIRARKGKAKGAVRITPRKGQELLVVLSEVQRAPIPPPVHQVIPPATKSVPRQAIGRTEGGSQARIAGDPDLKVPEAFR